MELLSNLWDFWVNVCIWFNTLLWSFAALVPLKGMYERGQLDGLHLILVKALALFFIVVIDGGGNIVLGTPMMLDRPREWTLTERCKRIKRENKTGTKIQRYRLWLAYKICDIANIFEKGHC